MCQHENYNDFYEPSEEEKEELEEILKQEFENKHKCYDVRREIKDRKLFTFNSEDHFAGWLRTYGIRWK